MIRARIQQPAQKLGCILELRDGRAIAVEGLSVTEAKHLRRSGGTGSVVVKGVREAINGKQILRIVPLPPSK